MAWSAARQKITGISQPAGPLVQRLVPPEREGAWEEWVELPGLPEARGGAGRGASGELEEIPDCR